MKLGSAAGSSAEGPAAASSVNLLKFCGWEEDVDAEAADEPVWCVVVFFADLLW